MAGGGRGGGELEGGEEGGQEGVESPLAPLFAVFVRESCHSVVK